MHGWGASSGWRTGVRILVGLVAAALLAGCDPVAPDPSGATAPGATPAATPAASPAAIGPTCETLAAVYAEHEAIADAFRALIDGDDDEALSAAAAIRGRLAAIVDAMPVAQTLPLAAERRIAESIYSTAEILLLTVDVLDPPAGRFDRLRALQDGEVILGALDWVTSRQPDSPIAMRCPDADFTTEPVVFPPRPDPSAFGLPDVVSGFVFRVRLGDLPSDLGDALRTAGVDLSTMSYLTAETVDWMGYDGFEVFDHVSVTPKVLLDSLGPERHVGISKRRTTVTVNGFDVVRYGSLKRGEDSLTAAVRGDRAILFKMEGFREVKDILEAMP